MGRVINLPNRFIQKATLSEDACMEMFHGRQNELLYKEEIVKTAIGFYKESVVNENIVSGDINMDEIEKFLKTSFLTADPEEIINAEYHIILQKDKTGNMFDMALVVADARIFKIQCVITKETPDHRLFYYCDGWAETTWESRYGMTYEQMRLMREPSVKTQVFAAAISSISGISDEELNRIFIENGPLMDFYEKYYSVCNFHYTDRLFLVPDSIGIGIYCENGKFKLAQLFDVVPDFMPKHFKPIKELTPKEAEQVIQSYFLLDNDYVIPLDEKGTVVICDEGELENQDNAGLTEALHYVEEAKKYINS